MKVNLPISGFAPFKVITALLFLTSFFFFKNFMMWLVLITPPVVGKAHALGAWIGMWRAGKLNWEYVSYILIFLSFFTYMGLKVWTLGEITLFTSLLFTVHFLYDEFDLQEEKREWFKFVTPVVIFFLVFLYFLHTWKILFIDYRLFFGIAIAGVLIEMMVLKSVTWFTLNTKIILAFLLTYFYLGIGVSYFMYTILFWHYFFWFIFPVYKLHKYKREERDSFILILLIIVGTSFYYSGTQDYLYKYVQDYAAKYFYILTIVHILGTAPFAYYIGLPRPKFTPAGRK